MLQLHDFELSGNCYKARLLLALLAVPYERIAVDLRAGAHKTPEYLQINPLGQVPVLIDGDVCLRDSQAILVYLARRHGGTDWLPVDADNLARIMQWLSNAANEIAHGLAAARGYYLMNRTHIDIEAASTRAHAFLRMLDTHLQNRDWLETDRPTIADIACFPYVALAHQGRIALDEYPHTRSWLARIKQMSRFVPMPGL
jgi:glutathione S-transferase